LTAPGLSRGDHPPPEVRLPLGTATLHISVALSAQATGPLSVRLQQLDTVVSSWSGVMARPVTGGAVFAVDLPSADLPEGLCRLVVSVPVQGEIPYWFRVTKTH